MECDVLEKHSVDSAGNDGGGGNDSLEIPFEIRTDKRSRLRWPTDLAAELSTALVTPNAFMWAPFFKAGRRETSGLFCLGW
jgi:hypothetical protein